jgi:hypothetical protein
MSKSYGNTIALADTPEEVKKKVMSMITDPARIRKEDPGHPDVCTVYAFQKVFNEEKVPEITEQCKGGCLGCVACKKMLQEKIAEFHTPIYEKRTALLQDEPKLLEILKKGREKASKKAEETIRWYKEQLSNLPCESWMILLIDKIWKEKGKGSRKTVVMDHKVLEETAKERGIGETKLREMIIKTMEKGEIDKEGYKGYAASEKESIERSMVFDEYRELYGIPKNELS